MQRNQSDMFDADASDARELDDGVDGGARPEPVLEEHGDDADEDRAYGVAHRPNLLPIREEDEQDLAEADIMEELELDEGSELDELMSMEGPDA
jgi:hypothetical protein